MSTTKVFYCSTLFGAITLAAASDVGHFGPRNERRVLIVSDNSAVPEAYPATDEQPGFAALRDRFDEIVSWNEIIAPLHPSEWSPRMIEIPMTSRMIMARLGLDAPPDELVLESIAVAPSRSIAGLLRDCPITVYSDGLMSYGPTRDQLPLETGGRITRLLHLDLVPDLKPLLLREWDVPAVAVPDEAFAAVLASIPATGPPVRADGRSAMILGQYLSRLGVLSAEEEFGLHERMLRALYAGGHRNVIFKAHPAAGHGHAHRLQPVADELGVRLTVAAGADPAEVSFREYRPDLVVGCFSTALATAAQVFEIPVATMGCETVLERLAPYENSNRIPTTIIDATTPRLRADGKFDQPDNVPLVDLVEAVGYCMQADTYPQLRPVAAGYLAEHGHGRYFKKRRLEALELMKSKSATSRTAGQSPALTPMARRANALRAAAAERIKRRIGG